MAARDTLESPLDLLSTVSPDQLSEDSVEEVVSRESPASSMTTPELSSDPSSSKLSEMLSLTLSTPEEKLSLLWTSSMLSRDKVELSTVSETEHDYISWLIVDHVYTLCYMVYVINQVA